MLASARKLRAPISLDPDVPWRLSLETAERIESADIQVILVKDGDHRLSREQDIALIAGQVENLLRRAEASPENRCRSR